LNAKLLYVNKIFRSKNLTENQKSKVLAAFDKAGTVAEAKLVFETISESVTAKKEVVKESLGSVSKPAGVAPTKQPIMEVDSQVARWQKLAGIK
jgi:3-hydroxyacyl-CoA dehydrogenase